MNQKHSPQTRLLTSFASIVIAFSSQHARSADITWNNPQAIAGASDVSTTGTLIGAFNVGDVGVPSTTVNGVAFQSFAAPSGVGSSGNFTMTSSGFGVFNSNTGGASANPPFTSLPAGYQTLLSSYVTPLFSPVTLSIAGLLVGMQYQFQCWSNESSDMFSYDLTASAGNSVTLASNDGHADGGLGEWVTGTFTADAATESIQFLGDGDGGFLNAFQLRQLNPTSAVPDSGRTLLLFSFVLAVLVFARNRFQAQS